MIRLIPPAAFSHVSQKFGDSGRCYLKAPGCADWGTIAGVMVEDLSPRAAFNRVDRGRRTNRDSAFGGVPALERGTLKLPLGSEDRVAAMHGQRGTLGSPTHGRGTITLGHSPKRVTKPIVHRQSTFRRGQRKDKETDQAALQRYVREGNWSRAVELYHIQRNTTTVMPETYAACMLAAVKARKPEEVSFFVGEFLVGKGLFSRPNDKLTAVKDEGVWNALVCLLAALDENGRAYSLLECLLQEGYTPSDMSV